MTAALDGDADFKVGDRVFVYPNNRDAPTHLRGIDGTVDSLDGLRVKVRGAGGPKDVFWVELALLHHDRRRERRTVDWSAFRRTLADDASRHEEVT